MKENNKLIDIKKLISKGMSLALATALVTSGLTACDEQTPANIDETTTPIVDTVTTAPTEEVTTGKELETLSPELAEKYPPISEEEYDQLIAMLMEKDEAYADGIDKMIITKHKEEFIKIKYFVNQDKYNIYATGKMSPAILDKLLELAGSNAEKIEIEGTMVGSEHYSIDLNKSNISKDKLLSIYALIYDLHFEQEKSLN